jgi:hypothetical protein
MKTVQILRQPRPDDLHRQPLGGAHPRLDPFDARGGSIPACAGEPQLASCKVDSGCCGRFVDLQFSPKIEVSVKVIEGE